MKSTAFPQTSPSKLSFQFTSLAKEFEPKSIPGNLYVPLVSTAQNKYSLGAIR